MRVKLLEKWRGMSLYRRALLVLLAAMIAGFGIATAVAVSQKGIEYQDAFLHFTEEDGVRRYTGRLDWKSARFTAYPDGTVEYRWGDEYYGPWQVLSDPSASPRGDYADWNLPGIEIRQGDRVLFRGGFHNGSWFSLIQEDGESYEMLDITFSSGGKNYDINGQELTQRDLHDPSLTAVARVSLDPELTHRGSLGLYLRVTLLAGMDIFMICFSRRLFYYRLSWVVQDPGGAEPTEWYTFTEKLSWTVLAAASAWLYWMALTVID